ncbi:MAG: ATP-binding protein [Myxococcales bacterium]|nr:ATP-binding protein [Myxococcales bacterium]
MSGLYGRQRQTAETETSGLGVETHWSETLTEEQQDSLAMELERLATRHAERLMKAAVVGEWETAITFAADTEAGRDVLAGALLGELARPSADVFPPRVVYGRLGPDCPLLLPAKDDASPVFPRSLASYLTGEELAALAAPPVEPLPGYEVRRTPTLSLTAPGPGSSDAWTLGVVCDHGRPLEGVEVQLGPDDLAKHLFVCGLTGSGKTTTVKELLAKAAVPFLVLEAAKRDYRRLLAVEGLRNRLAVYTVGDASVTPFRLNPFYVMPGVSALTHIDFLKAIFNASFSLYGPMPYILETCIHNVYRKRGWDLYTGRHPSLCDKNGEPDPARHRVPEAAHYFPTLVDLRDEVHDYVRSSLEYRGELSDNIRTAIVTRLDSLSVGAKGLLFGSAQPFDVGALLATPTVLELEALADDDDKAFFVGLMLAFISEHRQVNNPALDPFTERPGPLRHLLVIEEAHRLVKNVVQERVTEQLGNPRGKAVEFFANVISEMRAMGQGVVVVEQIPSKILPDVIKNTNVKLVHRLVSADDQAIVAASLGLSAEEASHLSSLPTGRALYAKEGMPRPVEVAVASTVPSIRIGHERVRNAMRGSATALAVDEAIRFEIRNVLGAAGDAVALQALCTLAASERGPFAETARLAIEKVDAALLARGHRVAHPSVVGYLADRIVALVALGAFRIHDDVLAGVGGVVQSWLMGDEQAARALQSRLAQGWSVPTSRQGVGQRVRELALDRVLRAGLEARHRAAIEAVVRSYFLVEVPGVCDPLVSQIVGRLEGEPWSG